MEFCCTNELGGLDLWNFVVLMNWGGSKPVEFCCPGGWGVLKLWYSVVLSLIRPR